MKLDKVIGVASTALMCMLVVGAIIAHSKQDLYFLIFCLGMLIWNELTELNRKQRR